MHACLASGLVLLLASVHGAAFGHGGGLDDRGGHNSSEAGRYHCHDGACQNVRHEVLIAESVGPVAFSEDGCNVASGEWHDAYSGETYHDPGRLDIDHLVPLQEVHRSGGAAWRRARKRDYAGNLTQPWVLIAVDLSENRSKGARGPSEWLLSNAAFHCEYVRHWTAVKERWDLDMEAEERAAVERIRRDAC